MSSEKTVSKFNCIDGVLDKKTMSRDDVDGEGFSRQGVKWPVVIEDGSAAPGDEVEKLGKFESAINNIEAD